MDHYIDHYIDSFVSAIDRKDYSETEELIWSNNENNKWDILNEMYIRSVLSIDRFQIIMKYNIFKLYKYIFTSN
jgi:hypothetical protein